MMTQYQEKATVIRRERFSPDNVRLTFDCPDIAAAAYPGQFVMIRVGTGNDPLLRRPFSIHQAHAEGLLQIYFKIVGRGTEMLAEVGEGAEVSILGPLGRGFRVAENPACLVGGGLGVAPLLFLARTLSRLERDHARDTIILGGRSSSEVEPLVKDFEQFGMTVVTTTDDGSYGRRGFVTAAFSTHSLPSSCTVYCCGPEPMLAGMSAMCRTRGYSCQVSVESVMACGMGACLGCSKPTPSGGYVHVCVDGPVFDAEEMVWNI